MTAEGPEEQPPSPTPVVPPDLRLRGERPRVTRLSRRVLIGLGAVSALAVAGALGYALQTRNAAQSGQELLTTQNRPSAEGLAGLPKDYTGLPRQAPPLGPPLPGDLGKPILNAGAAPNTVAPGDDARSGGAAPGPRDRGGAAQPSLRPDQSAAAAGRARRAGCDGDDGGSDAHTAGRRRRRAEHAGPQDGLPQCFDGQAHGQSRPARRQGLALCRAGRHCDSRRAHHRHPFRSARPDHRPGDGGGL